MKFEWKNCGLGSLVTFKNGKKRPETSGNFPVYGGNGVLGYTDKWNNENCVVIGRVGAYCGSVFREKGKCWISDNAICGVANNENIEYLYYLLRSLRLNQRHIGTSQPLLTQEILNSIQVSVPSYSTQNKIASILRCLDDKIELNNKINDNLERQAQAIYHEQFEIINKGELPVGWRVVTLGDVAVISKKIFNPSKEPETMLEHYSIPAFDESRFPVFELSTAIKSNKFAVDSNCFMISKLNPTTKRIWKPYCLTENAVCSTEFIVYKAKDSTIRDFLYSVIDSTSFSDFMCSHITGSTGSRQRTTPSDTLSFEFVIPSEGEINSFQALVSPMYEQMRINAIENNKLKRLRDSLLPKLMSGEINASSIQF